MIPGVDNSSCFPQSPPYGFHMYGIMEEIFSSSSPTPTAAAAGMPSVEVQVHPNSLLYNLSVIREKVQQVEAVVGMVVSPDQMHHTSVGAIAGAGAGALMQEIIAAATSMMFVFQQMASTEEDQDHEKVLDGGQPQEPRPGGVDGAIGQAPFGGGSSSEHKEAYNNNNNSNSNNSKNNNQMMMTNRFFDGGKEEFPQEMSTSHDNNQMIMTNARFFDGGKAEFPQEMSTSHEFPDLQHYDVIELDAADLLAKYTHYCHICGKGFKRDANLRMHMRAHGDEYKTNAALTNPMKKCSTTTTSNTTMGDYKVDHYSSQQQPQAPSRKYSCPQEGCRWNQKHAKFQPLKSMICVKNHYRRSHCPKMYVCNRCNRKQFSVLSDLRTHEKHCGDLKWRCSCGTTFSRKDKLMGHIALFVGHAPVVDVVVGATGHKGMIR